MPNEERMVRYNQSLMSPEAALGLSNHELLQHVVENKWFPVDTRFTIPPIAFLSLRTGVFSTVLNCIGEEKVQSFKTANLETEN